MEQVWTMHRCRKSHLIGGKGILTNFGPVLSGEDPTLLYLMYWDCWGREEKGGHLS